MGKKEFNNVDLVSAQYQAEEPKKKKKWWIVLLLILFMLLVIGGYQAWKYFTAEQKSIALQKELDAAVGILPGMTEEEIQDRLSRYVAEGRFNASMNGEPVFKNGRAKGNVNIENIPGNRYAFTVTIQVAGVNKNEYPDAAKYIGETVMTTGLLEPGSYLTEKKLDVALPKGKYSCIATFTAYQSEKDANGAEPKEIGATAMQLLLTVEE